MRQYKAWFWAVTAIVVSLADASTVTFKKKEVAKKAASYVLKIKAKASEKKACKALLVPSNATSLDDLSGIGALTKSNTKNSLGFRATMR